jgi:DNA-binding transcriptional ArsR family regulator
MMQAGIPVNGKAGMSVPMDERSATVLHADDPEFLEELSEYLEILSNSTRLRILKLLEKKAFDARSISMAVETSYENTKKHLERLLHAGLVSRRPGTGPETSKGVHPAWEYFQVPGALEGVQRDLGIFSAMHRQLSGTLMDERIRAARGQVFREYGGESAMLVVLGGEWDGRVIPVRETCLAIGRNEPGASAPHEGCETVAFPESYRSITRISRCHGRVTRTGGRAFIEDCDSTGGTYVNGKRLESHRRSPLRDGDVVDLSMGAFGAKLLFLEPGESGEQNHG